MLLDEQRGSRGFVITAAKNRGSPPVQERVHSGATDGSEEQALCRRQSGGRGRVLDSSSDAALCAADAPRLPRRSLLLLLLPRRRCCCTVWFCRWRSRPCQQPPPL